LLNQKKVYVDVILNHFTGAGNDLSDHRNPSAGCAKWGNKTSSAPVSGFIIKSIIDGF
jgi:alpha-amylase